MFEIQHEALREAQREIERLRAQHYRVWLGAGRPRRGGFTAWLRTLWSGQTDAETRPDEPARGGVAEQQSA